MNRNDRDNSMRYESLKKVLPLLLAAFIGLAGCETARTLKTAYVPSNATFPSAGPASYLSISEPASCEADCDSDLLSLSPNAGIDYNSVSYRDITLEQCIQSAMENSEVFRELGGAIVSQPGIVATALDPALQFTNPLVGEDAALSAFDADVTSNIFFENVSRPFNNRFSGDDGLLEQDLLTSELQFSKTAATGTEFTSTTSVVYDANNQTGNRFGSTWGTEIEAGIRHPLLQGSGSLFNRIAGPGGGPGDYNGVLIARTNTEISLADFEDSVREFVSNVENAYWDLYFAYRELEAQTAARDAAAKVAEKTKVLEEEEKIGRLELASANEQLLRFESALIESMEGRLLDGTLANSGASGGTFRRTIGVRTAERRLRYLIGMTITDGNLLKPADAPVKAALVFDWPESVGSAISKRPEIRRQKWAIKQRELELTAAKNFLLPRFDIVADYRFLGLGQRLAGGGGTFSEDVITDVDSSAARSSAIEDLFSGDFQELRVGAELAIPVGFRQARAGVRNAELLVQRERIVLKEQERKIVLDLSNAIAECRRAFNAMQAADDRVVAATEYRSQAEERLKTGRVQYDVLLEAQRRILEAQLQFINAEVEYAIAIKNVHFERATFLGYHGIGLAESRSDPKADSDYRKRFSRTTRAISYVIQDPPIGAKGGAGQCSECGNASGCECQAGAASEQLNCVDCLSDDHHGNEHVAETFEAATPASGSNSKPNAPVKTSLPATGTGKKHVYQPQFLPLPSAN